MKDINISFEKLWQEYSSEPNNMGKNNTMRKEAARSLCGFLQHEADFSNIDGNYVTKENVIDAIRNSNNKWD